MTPPDVTGHGGLALSTGSGRRLVLATALASGMVFLDCTVTPLASPAIVRELGGGMSVQQWILDGYLLTLSSLLLLGGALGDRSGHRRVFVIGLLVFSVASIACGIAPSTDALVLSRVAQGVGGALLVPGSLALIRSAIRPEDRGKALGLWAGMSGVGSALGPIVGGWLVDAASWRAVFLVNAPLGLVAVWTTLRHTPDARIGPVSGRLDVAGATAIMVGLSGLTYTLIETPAHGWSSWTVLSATVGVVGLLAFLVVEARSSSPLLPLTLFRSAHFVGANITTFAVEGAVGAAFFLLALQLQQSLGYTALAAGLAMLPLTVLMLLLAPWIGAMAQRRGPRLPMTLGPLLCAAGLALLARVVPGAGFVTDVLPGVAVFGLGLAITVAPLTAAVLAGVDERHVGAAAGTNNALAWTAGLIAVAALPAVAGVHSSAADPLGHGFTTAMLLAAAMCAVGGVVAFASIRNPQAALVGSSPACASPNLGQAAPTSC
ncbi:MAG TPA: DHA2 family efflux MFS transporter permease subunit [Nocardioides sp.]|nr:DHA2 family efflux MFS transporter permease subunit [Nocardioides sp.]